jgi:hypothetical protein
MTPSELRRRYADLNRQQDKDLDDNEREITARHKLERKTLFREAGEKTSCEAELEDAYYDLFPPRSELPDDVQLVEVITH